MRKQILKILFILILLVFFGCVNVYATDDAASADSVAESTEVEQEENVTEDEDVDKNYDEDIQDEPSHDDAVSTTGVSNSIYTPEAAGATTTRDISSYSTISNIPEANLKLNNILNIILIAVSVIIILLAIAILIRIK